MTTSSQPRLVPSIEDQMNTAIRRLYYWQNGGTSFTCRLYELMTKADQTNLSRIGAAFPIEYNAFVFWRAAPDQAQFFRDNGLFL